MAFHPIINNSFAGLQFSPSYGYGDAPVPIQYQLDDLPDPETQVYQVGTLLGFSTGTAGNLVIYDSTDQATNPFKGVFFDETAPAAVDGVQEGFVNCAINDRPSTLWLYDILVGANSGTTDIDYLITNGFANVVYQTENNVQIKCVQFKGMGTKG